jgi:glycosyltransferase involved in cell wall biosynthesis
MQSRMGNSPIPVRQVACGVPMADPVTREIRKAGPLRILYLGRVAEQQKRASLMARVIRQSLDSGLDLAWTIAGDGPDLLSLHETFTKDGDRVHFLGAVPYSEVPNVLAEHDVYFLCSDFEGLPLSMLEAMGAGCVPVVSDLPSGISEVVNDANGIRVPISGPDGYVAALTELCQDRGRLAAMATAAAQTVREKYSTVAMGRRWNQVLDEYAKPTKPDWSQPCTADAPPECRARWYFHPKLRPARRLLKICSKYLHRST